MRLFIATNNRGKQKEYRALLQGLPVRLVFPSDLGIKQTVEEDGMTYAQNAARKALAWGKATGLVCLADDSGLEVEALGGAPGLYSARYAPIPNATDADRRRYLLSKLRGLPRPWNARFVCTVAVALPEGIIHFAEGQCRGEIIPQERGAHGFGYDPIFYLPQFGRTMAEILPEEKNRISHRARAVRAILPILQAIAERQGIEG